PARRAGRADTRAPRQRSIRLTPHSRTRVAWNTMKVISYNLRKHRAARELEELVAQHEPDLLCLQECDVTALPEAIGGLALADATQGNRLGLAIYYRANTFVLKGIRAF